MLPSLTAAGYNWISYGVGLLTFPIVALANCICACALYRLAAPRLGRPLPAGCTPSVEHEVIEKTAAAESAAQAAAAAGARTQGADAAAAAVASPWQRERSFGTAGSTGADGYRLTVAFRATQPQSDSVGVSPRHPAEGAWTGAATASASVSSDTQQASAGRGGGSSGEAGAQAGSATSDGGGAVGDARPGLLDKLLPWRKRKIAADVATSTASAPPAAAQAPPKVAKPKIPSAFRRALRSALHVRSCPHPCADHLLVSLGASARARTFHSYYVQCLQISLTHITACSSVW